MSSMLKTMPPAFHYYWADVCERETTNMLNVGVEPHPLHTYTLGRDHFKNNRSDNLNRLLSAAHAPSWERSSPETNRTTYGEHYWDMTDLARAAFPRSRSVPASGSQTARGRQQTTSPSGSSPTVLADALREARTRSLKRPKSAHTRSSRGGRSAYLSNLAMPKGAARMIRIPQRGVLSSRPTSSSQRPVSARQVSASKKPLDPLPFTLSTAIPGSARTNRAGISSASFPDGINASMNASSGNNTTSYNDAAHSLAVNAEAQRKEDQMREFERNNFQALKKKRPQSAGATVGRRIENLEQTLLKKSIPTPMMDSNFVMDRDAIMVVGQHFGHHPQIPQQTKYANSAAGSVSSSRAGSSEGGGIIPSVQRGSTFGKASRAHIRPASAQHSSHYSSRPASAASTRGMMRQQQSLAQLFEAKKQAAILAASGGQKQASGQKMSYLSNKSGSRFASPQQLGQVSSAQQRKNALVGRRTRALQSLYGGGGTNNRDDLERVIAERARQEAGGAFLGGNYGASPLLSSSHQGGSLLHAHVVVPTSGRGASQKHRSSGGLSSQNMNRSGLSSRTASREKSMRESGGRPLLTAEEMDYYGVEPRKNAANQNIHSYGSSPAPSPSYPAANAANIINTTPAPSPLAMKKDTGNNIRGSPVSTRCETPVCASPLSVASSGTLGSTLSEHFALAPVAARRTSTKPPARKNVGDNSYAEALELVAKASRPASRPSSAGPLSRSGKCFEGVF